jgi:hypothetical protein
LCRTCIGRRRQLIFGRNRWKRAIDEDSTKLLFLLSVPNEWFYEIGNKIGYDSVRPWLARQVVSTWRADFVDFLLAGGVCLRNGVIARGGMSVAVKLWC